jgi:hypothetical protein
LWAVVRSLLGCSCCCNHDFSFCSFLCFIYLLIPICGSCMLGRLFDLFLFIFSLMKLFTFSRNLFCCKIFFFNQW